MKRLMGAFWALAFVGKLVVASKVNEFAATVAFLGVGPTDIHAHHHAAKIFGWFGNLDFLFWLRSSLHEFF